ncbi:MAG: type I-B CRISPR-associated protein Cas7/Csh2 [Halothiobacillaceae bacterium]
MQLTNRTEILFCYDIKDNNPNGDPLDGNKPRIDEATDTNIVTDVRLKRTVRDYLKDFRGQEILIEQIEHEDGSIQTGIERAMNFFDAKGDASSTERSKKEGVRAAEEIVRANVLKHCIDARLFGCTLPLDKGSVTLTGPVQFRMGRSLNKVELTRIKGSGAFASKAGADQNTFREEYILPYSFITFYGLANENAAKDTGLTTEDLALLYDGLWNGTKNLISRSKIGQTPRLLLAITYRENNYHIGDLDKALALKPGTGLKEEQVRDVGDFALDVSELLNLLGQRDNKILNVAIKADPRLRFSANGNDLGNDISAALRNLGLTVASFEGF